MKDDESNFLRRLDDINMNPSDRARAKANLVQAELLADLLLRVVKAVRGFGNRLLVNPIRRGLALIA